MKKGNQSRIGRYEVNDTYSSVNHGGGSVHCRKLRKRHQRSLNKLFSTVLLITVVLVMVFVLTGFSHPTVQHVGPSRCYKIITVHADDTLWDIAQENLSAQEQPIRLYIKEIMEVNGLVSSMIYSGQRLAIPYDPDLAGQGT